MTHYDYCYFSLLNSFDSVTDNTNNVFFDANIANSTNYTEEEGDNTTLRTSVLLYLITENQSHLKLTLASQGFFFSCRLIAVIVLLDGSHRRY